MTSVATGFGVCCAVGLNMASVFVQQTPPPPIPKPPIQTSAKSTVAEITVTGCLVQGSAANVFILQNAKQDPQSAGEKAARYVVVPAAEDLVLKPHLNHQVRLLGVPDGRPQPVVQAGTPVDEKSIPALSAKSLTMVAASCGTGAGGGYVASSGVSGARPSFGGGAIGLGAGAGMFASGAFGLASSSGSAGSRSGFTGLYAGRGFGLTSSVTGAVTQGGPSDFSDPEVSPEFFDEDLESGYVSDWIEPASYSSSNAEVVGPPSPATAALIDHVAQTTAAELLGEDVPTPKFAMAQAMGAPRLVNPEPGTLLLIATGLLLVVYAGRRREWRVFGRRSLR